MNTTFVFTVLIVFWVDRSEIPHCYDGNHKWEEHDRKNRRRQSGKWERREHLTGLSLITCTKCMCDFRKGEGSVILSSLALMLNI